MVDDGAYLGNIQITGLGSRYFKKTYNGDQKELSYLITAKSDELVLVYQLGVLKAGTVVEISNLSVVETDEQITTAPVVTTADPYAPTESAPEGYTMITPNLNNWDTFGSKGQCIIYNKL